MGYLIAVAILTAAQIYDYATQAGFKGQEAINATAIALAESSGNTSVVNGIGATGLWQIYNGVGQNGLNDPTFRANMQDPLQNAKAAYAKFQASQQTSCGGWWPWATYNEGPCHNSDPNRNNAWRGFLAQVQNAIGGGTTDTGTDGGGTTAGDTNTSVASGAALVTAAGSSSAPSLFGNEALGKLVARLASPGFWWSVGFFVLAGLLIVAGLLVVFHKQVEQVAGQVGKAAAVAA